MYLSHFFTNPVKTARSEMGSKTKDAVQPPSVLPVTSTSPLSSIGCWRYNNVMPPRPWHGPITGGLTQADFYILLVLAAFLLSLPAAVFIFYWIPRTKKEKEKKEMEVVDQQRPLETVLTLESALPSYEEATKSRRADKIGTTLLQKTFCPNLCQHGTMLIRTPDKI